MNTENGSTSRLDQTGPIWSSCLGEIRGKVVCCEWRVLSRPNTHSTTRFPSSSITGRNPWQTDWSSSQAHRKSAKACNIKSSCDRLKKTILKSLKINRNVLTQSQVTDSSRTVWVWAIKGVGFNSAPCKYSNGCNVISSCYSLRTALYESIRYQVKSEQNVRQDRRYPGMPRGSCSHAPLEVHWTT